MYGAALGVASIGVLALVSLVFYRLGRLAGIREGSDCAEKAMPIRLRQQAMVSGVCPVCDTEATSMVQCAQRGG